MLFVAATMLMTREADECSALDVIALVADVNWSAWVTLNAPALLEKLTPLESWNVSVWNVDEASAENA